MKKVYEYMGIEPEDDCESISFIACSDTPNCKECTLKKNVFLEENGNLIVLAINAMRDKGDYDEFERFFFDEWYKERADRLGVWLFGNPAKFFELMEEWLNEKAD